MSLIAMEDEQNRWTIDRITDTPKSDCPLLVCNTRLGSTPEGVVIAHSAPRVKYSLCDRFTYLIELEPKPLVTINRGKKLT